MIAHRLMCAAVILSLVATASDAASPAAALDIHNDSGGRVLDYAIRFERASKPIRIFGRCASACTLALKYPSTCVGPRASLVFHQATHPRLTAWLLRQYPARIRLWIGSNGGLTAKLISLQGGELHKRVTRCK